jgi:hypothetical protein
MDEDDAPSLCYVSAADYAKYWGTSRSLNESPRRCGVVAGSYTCDREAGHTGSHRGYDEQIDEPMFWAQR